METIKFVNVLQLFESHGWVLEGIYKIHRVFINPKDNKILPWTIPVKNGKVDSYYYIEIKRFFDNENEGS